MGKFFTPSLNTSTNYTINFANAFYNPHSEHNKSGGGILASTGFQINGDTSTEYFFDEDGAGVLRIYSVVSCLLYTSPSPRDKRQSRMPSSA